MLTSSITSKGQVTLPAALRKRLNLKAGDQVVFTLQGNKIIAEPMSGDIASLFGIVQSDLTVSLEQIEDTIEAAASEQ